MELSADAQENAAGADRREATVVKSLAQLHDVFDAVGLDQEAAAVKGVDVKRCKK